MYWPLGEVLAKLALVQELAYITLRRVDAQLFGLEQQNLPLHQLLANLLLNHARDRRVASVLGITLLHLLGRRAC